MVHNLSQTLSSELKRKMQWYITRNKNIILVFLLCFVVSIIFCTNEFPSGADIPAHYMKIRNMESMLKKGKFVLWSYDWYNGYAMFEIYPPLTYILAAFLDLLLNDVAATMKIFTIASFSSYPILLYRLGRTMGRSNKGATYMALLFSLTPLNVFFLFNGYFVFIISLALMFIFLTEFIRYIQNRAKTKFLSSVFILAIISLTYHRALYFILFIIFFHLILKIYRRQLKETASVIIMTAVGVGMTSFWLLPAITSMLTFQSEELFQSLIVEATYSGVSFQAISLLFIVPYCFLVFKKIKIKGLKTDLELTLLLSLIFFAILTLGPYGPLHYIVPFSSSQRVEVTLLMVTFLATVLASNLFDEGVKDGKRTFRGILVSSSIFLSLLTGIFVYPQTAYSIGALNFVYSRGELKDSVVNLISNAYVNQQVFLGKNDEDFLKVLQYIHNNGRDGGVAFYSNRSQTVDMFYYYALIPLSGRTTPQGIAPDGEGDLKWDDFTKKIIWQANETLLRLSGTRWVISNYNVALVGDQPYKRFGEYQLYELDEVKVINGCEGYVNKSVGEIEIVLTQKCRNFTFSMTYHPRWRAFDQDGKSIKIERSEYSFMRISSANDINKVRIVYSELAVDVLGKSVSLIFLLTFILLCVIARLRVKKAVNYLWA